jgi:hypothetical protein
MFILETVFGKDEQNIYTVEKRLDVTESGWYREVSQINCFFHRWAKDRIHYNVTNFRQFTYYHERWELDFLNNADWVKRYEVETLEKFFEKVGFVYKTKTWKCLTEHPKKWNGRKYVS